MKRLPIIGLLWILLPTNVNAQWGSGVAIGALRSLAQRNEFSWLVASHFQALYRLDSTINVLADIGTGEFANKPFGDRAGSEATVLFGLEYQPSLINRHGLFGLQVGPRVVRLFAGRWIVLPVVRLESGVSFLMSRPKTGFFAFPFLECSTRPDTRQLTISLGINIGWQIFYPSKYSYPAIYH